MITRYASHAPMLWMVNAKAHLTKHSVSIFLSMCEKHGRFMISPVLGISRWDYKSRWLANGSSCTDVENSEECFLLSLYIYIYWKQSLRGYIDLLINCWVMTTWSWDATQTPNYRFLLQPNATLHWLEQVETMFLLNEWTCIVGREWPQMLRHIPKLEMRWETWGSCTQHYYW